MKYIKATIDDSRLLENIYRAEASTQKNVILIANKETQDYFERNFAQPQYPDVHISNPKCLIGKYCGYKMLRDDSLDFGEIKIYSECS